MALTTWLLARENAPRQQSPPTLQVVSEQTAQPRAV
jgi:hypothetical protein